MTWSDEELEKMFLSFNRQMLGIERELMAQRAVVVALKTWLASELEPGNPRGVLDKLHRLEESILASDARFQAKKESAELLDLFRKHGMKSEGES